MLWLLITATLLTPLVIIAILAFGGQALIITMGIVIAFIVLLCLVSFFMPKQGD